jgi:hypothetical protein
LDSDVEVVAIRLDPGESEPVATVWFEIDLSLGGYASFYLGADTGSRGVAQTIRLTLSNASSPFQDLARFAEQAYRGNLPFSIDLDSEGPESRLAIRSGPKDNTAIFEIHETYTPIVYCAAVVDPRQLGLALAHAMRVAIDNPGFVRHWIEWYFDYGRQELIEHDYFGSAWLRDLVIDQHPSGDYVFEGIDTYNQTNYVWN